MKVITIFNSGALLWKLSQITPSIICWILNSNGIEAKGIYFISHTNEFQLILEKSKFPWVSFILAHYVAHAHIAGGLLIAVGMFTRLAVALQIPVLLGAVILVNSEKGFFSESSDLAFSLMVLLLLVFYFFYGSGFWSVDHTWKKKEEAESAA